MYLKHFNLSERPFSLTPNIHYFLPLKDCAYALNILLIGLHSREGFIKITGEIGTGKTLLCRKILSKLKKHYNMIYIPNPSLSPFGLYQALADELNIPTSETQSQHQIIKKINHALTRIHQHGGRVILLIDEAQALPDETLEALRLMTNFETETEKLLQVVLFGQPELDISLAKKELRQIKQRITLSYHLGKILKKDIKRYVSHRLMVAGCKDRQLFTDAALTLLYKASEGTPRIINILCHKALLSAFGRGDNDVRRCDVYQAIKDTEVTMQYAYSWWNRLMDRLKLVSSV